MKRPLTLVHGLLIVSLLVMIGEAAGLVWLAPHYLLRKLERAAGGQLMIGGAHVSLPWSVTLTDVRLVHGSAQAMLTVPRVVVKPRWVSWPSRIVWLEMVDIEQPLLQLTRASDGSITWPNIAAPAPAEPSAAPSPPPPAAHPPASDTWCLRIDSLKVTDGVVEFIDRKAPHPFHGSLDHVSFTMGPVTLPQTAGQMTFAFRSEFVGDAGHAAPFYCSGWLEPVAKDLQAYCQLEPLAMGAFEPYYQGRLKVRVYNATLKSTSRWVAKANELEGRIQLELNNLTEGDISVRGTTVMDIKRLAGPEGPRLQAEIKLVGPLNNPGEWRPDFVPGNALVQQLVKPLLDRGIEMVRISFGGGTISLSLSPATKMVMSGIEEASKQVQEALQILAAPIETPAATPAAPASPPAPGAATPVAPVSSADGTPPASPAPSPSP